ncbi:MAG: hypothetical protein WBG41_12980 [Acidimicrobiales bacterium]
MARDEWGELVRHVTRTTLMDPYVATRVIEETVAYFSESVEDVVRRRHRELQSLGIGNAEIFRRIREELGCRPVAAPDLTERQIRRLIYG